MFNFVNTLKRKIIDFSGPLSTKNGYTRCLRKDDLNQKKKGGEKVGPDHPYFISRTINFGSNLDIDKKINSVISWVPYIKDKTSVIIYNFFSNNYAIRKNIILKIVLLKNHKILFTKYATMKQNDIIELKDIFNNNDIEEGIIAVEAIHPNIPKNHGGGQFRFWGKYCDINGNYLSTVHSMPLKNTRHEKIKIYSRNYFPKSSQENSNLNISLDKIDTKKRKSELCLGGYNLILDKNGNPNAIWHLGPAYLSKNENLKFITSSQCFWIPKNNNLNPKIIIDDKETFLKKDDVQKLNVKIIYDSKVHAEENIEYSGFFERSVEEIFGEKFSFEYIIYIEFLSKSFSYTQINYDGLSIGDQIHTHNSNIYYNKVNEIDFHREEVPKNCRKFMHINVDNENYSNYLIVHNNKIKGIKSKKFKVRLLHETGYEAVENFQINEDKLILSININDLFSKTIKKKNLKKAIIQLESKDCNFDASMICQNNLNDHIAVDHLTGG